MGEPRHSRGDGVPGRGGPGSGDPRGGGGSRAGGDPGAAAARGRDTGERLGALGACVGVVN
jgi:hypothetical protein